MENDLKQKAMITRKNYSISAFEDDWCRIYIVMVGPGKIYNANTVVIPKDPKAIVVNEHGKIPSGKDKVKSRSQH